MQSSNKALPEVIPPRICITFRRATFRSRPKRSKSRIWDDQVENMTNTDLKRHDNFSENLKNHEIGRNWTHIRRIGLRIKPFESQGCYQSNGNPPDPQNCHRKFKIDQKSNGPNRPHCPLNLAINRMCNSFATG